MGPLGIEEYRIILETAPILIWRADRTKGCDWFNETWLRFTGRTMEQELGLGWADGIPDEERDEVIARYVEHFDRREPFELVYRLRRADGAYRWVVDRGAPAYDADGAFTGYVGSGTDVTERIEAERAQEEALARLNELLPICAACKRVRRDDGRWSTIEEFLHESALGEITHGLCPVCAERALAEEGGRA